MLNFVKLISSSDIDNLSQYTVISSSTNTLDTDITSYTKLFDLDKVLGYDRSTLTSLKGCTYMPGIYASTFMLSGGIRSM